MCVAFAPTTRPSISGNEGIAADMDEMEVRVDDQLDARRVSVDRFEPGADLLARLEVDPEQPGEARVQPPGRVMLAVGGSPVSNNARASRVLDQKHRDRYGDVALAAL